VSRRLVQHGFIKIIAPIILYEFWGLLISECLVD
jgi:hypothetical protein